MSYSEENGLVVRMSKKVSRFEAGQTVWVRDFRSPRGYKIVEAKVEDRHYHPGRHPWYPNGEGYDLAGDLWWTCYPGCRVFATREEATAARLPKNETEANLLALQIWNRLNSGNPNYTPYPTEKGALEP